MADDEEAPIVVENQEGAGAFVVLCDHASSHLPDRYGSLGLTPADLTSHIAWDPGALNVARRMSARLDAPLIWPNVSRLVIDCNRSLRSSGVLSVAITMGQPSTSMPFMSTKLAGTALDIPPCACECVAAKPITR